MMTVNRILVLLAVDILGDNSHGNAVAGLIINTTGRHESLRRSVHVTLHRMRDLGLVSQLRAGAESPRPFYRVTKRGRDELLTTLDELEQLGRMARKILKVA